MSRADPASLANLHDIISAPPVSWWPPAPGWLVFGCVIMAGLCWGLWAWLRDRQANAYRRAALAQLDRLVLQLQDAGRREAALRALPELVKRTALAAWPRQEVARLSGERWLAWLDKSWSRQQFVDGPGRLLAQLAYVDGDALSALPDEELDALVCLVRNWIRSHRHPQGNGRGGQHA